jgi:hypothetical protein
MGQALYFFLESPMSKQTWISILFAAAIAACWSSRAEALIIYSGDPVLPIETFDSLGSAELAGYVPAVVGQQVPAPGTSGFDIAKLAGDSTVSSPFRVGDGSSPVAGIYSFGNAGSPDRALGSIADEGNAYAFGFAMRNDSPIPIKSVTIRYRVENWRVPTETLNFVNTNWGTTAINPGVSPSNYLTMVALQPEAPLLNSLQPEATSHPVNGNLPEASYSETFTFTRLGEQRGLNIPFGEYFFVRWQDRNRPGDDAGVALDDLEIFVEPIPEPSSLCLLGLVCAMAAWRRWR